MRYLLLIVSAVILGLGCNPKTNSQAEKNPSHVMGFSATGPIIPSSWTQASWFFDPSNSSGVASDSNACTTSAAPCLTWHEINDHRWGCTGNPSNCPRLRQNTTVTQMSSHSDDTDPIYMRFAVENQSIFTLTCSLGAAQQVGSGTFSGTVAKVRTNGASSLQTETLTTGLAVGQLLNNTTHPGWSFLYKNTSGTTWNLTQPLTQFSIPAQAFSTTEVTTYADGDSYVVYSLINSNLVDIEPIVENHASGLGKPQIYVTHCNIWDPTSSANNTTVIGQNVLFVESASTRGMYRYGYDSSAIVDGWSNHYATTGHHAVMTTGAQQTHILYGGALTGFDFNDSGTGLRNIIIDGDAIIDESVAQIRNAQISSLYIPSGRTIQLLGDSQLQTNITGAFLWGPGTGQVTGAGRFVYPTGAGAAAASLLVSTLKSNTATAGCLGVPTAASAYATCNIALTAANLDTNLGATSGCVGTPNGGAFCNYGP